MELTAKQDWKLKQIRKESNFLWMNKDLGEEVFLMGKEGKSDNEITWALWQKEWAEKFWISPEAIHQYLKDRGLDGRTRKAIKLIPVVQEANTIIGSLAMNAENEAVRLKAATWIADKYDIDTEPKDKGTTNVFNMSGITQIIVE